MDRLLVLAALFGVLGLEQGEVVFLLLLPLLSPGPDPALAICSMSWPILVLSWTGQGAHRCRHQHVLRRTVTAPPRGRPAVP